MAVRESSILHHLSLLLPSSRHCSPLHVTAAVLCWSNRHDVLIPLCYHRRNRLHLLSIKTMNYLVVVINWRSVNTSIQEIMQNFICNIVAHFADLLELHQFMLNFNFYMQSIQEQRYIGSNSRRSDEPLRWRWLWGSATETRWWVNGSRRKQVTWEERRVNGMVEKKRHSKELFFIFNLNRLIIFCHVSCINKANWELDENEDRSRSRLFLVFLTNVSGAQINMTLISFIKTKMLLFFSYTTPRT